MDTSTRISLKHFTPEEKRARLAAQNLAYYHRHKNDPEFRKKRTYFSTVSMQKKPWKGIVKGACDRATKRGIPCDIDFEWAEARWTGRCELTGLEFRPNRGHGCGPAPFSPSIDRIEPSKGYTKDNCRFIIHALNALKGSGSEDEAFAIAKAWVLTEIGKGMTPPVPREALESFFPTPRDRS